MPVRSSSEYPSAPASSSPPSGHPFSPALHGREALFSEALTVAYMALIATLASGTGFALIFFPELAALAYDVFRRPRGAWASAPWLLALTPVATATIGVLVTRMLPFGLPSILLAVGGSVALVQVLRSPVAPAISAGLLPLVLHVESWLYPPCILVGTTLLVASSWVWQRYALPRVPRVPATNQEIADELIELSPRRRAWMPALLLFVIGIVVLVQWSDLRFILFPPLVVIAFEMFGHPSICPWARKPIRMPIACSLTAVGGILAVTWLGPGAASTALSLSFAILILRVFDLHVPPALAVALIPQILTHPGYHYPISVAVGASCLSIFFLGYRRVLLRFAENKD